MKINSKFLQLSIKKQEGIKLRILHAALYPPGLSYFSCFYIIERPVTFAVGCFNFGYYAYFTADVGSIR